MKQGREAKEDSTLENKKKAKPRKESIEAKHLRRYEALQAKEEDGNSKATGGSGEPRSRMMLHLQTKWRIPYVSFRCPPFSGPDLGLKIGVA